jgi:LmbE family N-acetylglucosaminyl deacetylase
MNTSLFILAHPDDDLMAWPLMNDMSASHRLVVIYTTNTDEDGSNRRKNEAMKALSNLTIHDINFIEINSENSDGTTIGIAHEIASEIEAIAKRHAPISHVTTHALEGGNPDHDLAFCIASGLVERLGNEVDFKAIPFYRKHPVSWLPFTVQRPLPGLSHKVFKTSRVKSLAILLAARHYRSQAAVLSALLPLYLLKLFARGGVLYHTDRAAETYMKRIENSVMITRQYSGDPEEFYQRLEAFLADYRHI